jgi:hypothetical protein
MFITSEVRSVAAVRRRAENSLILRAAVAVLVASVAGCSSESDGSAPGGGTGAVVNALDGSAAGGAGNPGGAGSSAGAGASGGPSRGGNMSSTGGVSSGGGRSGATTGGGSSVGGAVVSGGRPGAGGSSGASGGSVGGCTSVGASCNPDTTICCPGAVCVTSTSADYAGCREECTTAADCASGCCIPFANIPNKGFCGAATLCQCAGQDETCGGTRQCCGGLSCSTFDSTGALACHKTCTQNSECSTNCCVKIAGTPDSVCLPAKPFCGQ